MYLKKCRATPLICRHTVSQTLFILGIALVAPPHTLFFSGPSDHYLVSAFGFYGLSPGELKTCEDKFEEADEGPKDGKITPSEYNTFITLWTNGRINEPTPGELPLDLILYFNSNKDGDTYFDITDAGNVFTKCNDIKNILDDILPPTPSPTTLAPTTSRSSPTTTPTQSPTTSPTTTPTQSPTTSPTATRTQSPTTSPATTPPATTPPATTPTTPPGNSPTTTPSSEPTNSERVEVRFSYDITTDGASGQEIMNEENNNIKNDLISVTTPIVSRIVENGRRLSRRVNPHPSAERQALRGQNGSLLGNRKAVSADPDERNLANNHDVTIESATSMDCKVAKSGSTCFIINSIATVFIRPDEDPDYIHQIIFDGIKTTFQDGSFEDALL